VKTPMCRMLTAILAGLLLALPGAADDAPPAMNLLLNPSLAFHSFDNSRTGKAACYTSGAVPCWDQDAYGDAEVFRATRQTEFRPPMPVPNVVAIHPGKRFRQFALLAEMGLDHGDRVSFSVRGRQAAPDSLEAAVHLMRLDSQSGQWKPAFDKRPFPKHSRGELVRGPSYRKTSGRDADFRIQIAGAQIVGAFTESPDESNDEPNTIGIEVEMVNRSADKDVWITAPCLCRGVEPRELLPAARPMPTYYRGIPRTIQKLWRGAPLHIIVMGSIIDRGSANPPQTLFDENPESPTFKEPLSGREFDGSLVGHPEWNDYFAWWQHWFMYAGRLRRALMTKFDYPIDKLLLNTMACDGSSVGESHSGLAEYASLAIPPDPAANGHRSGKTWQELYPALFARPEGPRPDLVIYGSGANEKIDGAAEIAVFEGAIRWFQRHYPGTEFLFCMWQNRETYTPNTGHLMELSLRYQIPYVDFARLLSLTTRHCNSYALVPRDGHPQAAGHYLWFKQLERAFDAADPIEPGAAQLHLPERAHPCTVGWEGEMVTYANPHPRIRGGTALMLDDTVVNLWAASKDELVGIRLDGKDCAGSRRKPMKARNNRNSTFATGLLSLGDRHIVEVTGQEARVIAADCKLILNRQWTGVDSPRWSLGGLKHEAFKSDWGEPCGGHQVRLPAGSSAEIDLAGTDFSIAYAGHPEGGTLVVEVDGREMLRQPANVPFVTAGGESLFMENRRGLCGLPYGAHSIRVTAADGPVALLGVFSYDTRPNRANERVVRGTASPGEVVQFAAPFAARPIVLTTGGLLFQPSDLTPTEIRFRGTGPGGFEIVGE